MQCLSARSPDVLILLLHEQFPSIALPYLSFCGQNWAIRAIVVALEPSHHRNVTPLTMKLKQAERRSSGRYPIQQEVVYTLLDGRNRCETVAGRTVDMSSGGILFTTSEAINPGKRLEIAVNWP